MSGAYELLDNLAACLCAELTPTGKTKPDLCFCGVIPGARVPHDYAWTCGTGMAWVRLASAYPAEGVGVRYDGVGSCGSGLGMTIELGVIRCFPTMDENGNPPPVEDYCAMSALQVSDMLAMRRAVSCCTILEDFDEWQLGIYTPTGPLGGVGGGVWTLEVFMP